MALFAGGLIAHLTWLAAEGVGFGEGDLEDLVLGILEVLALEGLVVGVGGGAVEDVDSIGGGARLGGLDFRCE